MQNIVTVSYFNNFWEFKETKSNEMNLKSLLNHFE